MGLLGIFVVLPFIQGILRLNKYDKSMKSLIRYRVKHLSGIYQRTSFFTYLLAVLLTIATLPISIQSLNNLVPSLKGDAKKRFYTHSMLRAYSLALFWSPVELLVIASIDQLNASYLVLMPILLLTSLTYLFFDWLLHRRTYFIPLEEMNIEKKGTFNKKDALRIVQFFVAVILLFVFVLVTDHFLQEGLLVAIVIVVIPFSFAWIIVLRKLPIYLTYMKKSLYISIGNMNNFVALFLSAGFFISMMEKSVLFDHINEFVINQFQSLHLAVFFFFIAAIFWITSLCGFFSVVTITLLAQVLAPIASGLENSLALLFIGSTISLLMISPFNIATAIMATLIRSSPLKIFKWNFKFAFGFMILVTTISVIYELF
ncbi:hypothetical protein [Siminovitchia fortis]|nr:hypothetical protein [Siminovitchia fortis]